MINKKWDKTFNERLSKYYDELKWLYCELYDNDMQALEYFVKMLYGYYSNRSDVLKDWDEARNVVKDWFAGNEMLGMLMYTNCFAKDLKGVKKHLDYLLECGVNYVHLMPLLESPEGRSDGGY
ncbi:MAG: amylosucrase, partial [Lachnospiraceae bacterium]|nr:amylosucrase [Lachnospiraceae bacterium]